MSEQITQPENPDPDNVGPDNAQAETQTLPKQPEREQQHKLSAADSVARVGITQLTMVVMVIIFLWQWLDGHRAINDMEQQLAKKIAEMDGNSKASQILLSQSQDQVRELFAKVTTMETRYAESQNQRAALEALYNDLSVNRDEATLAEVEQMLLVASQQLQLSANVRAALIALQSADARLQRMNRPAFNGLRKAIGQDIDRLRALPSVDFSGINLQLNDLINDVDQMPLGYQQRMASEAVRLVAPAADETAWQKLLREIWQEVRQLVRIQDTGKSEIPLLPPNQEFFLRENLKLQLLSARLALLSRDEDSFRLELKSAQLWTARYFDGQSREVMQMSDGLKKLTASDISIELPDISPTLQVVRNYRLTREKEPKATVERIHKEPKPSSKGRSKAAR